MKVQRVERLFRASVDGFSEEAFLKKCKKKEDTVVLIRTKLGETIGCYTHYPWQYFNCWKDVSLDSDEEEDVSLDSDEEEDVRLDSDEEEDVSLDSDEEDSDEVEDESAEESSEEVDEESEVNLESEDEREFGFIFSLDRG